MYDNCIFLIFVLFSFSEKAYSTKLCYLCSSKESGDDCSFPRTSRLKLSNCTSEALDTTQKYAQAIHYGYAKPFRVEGADIVSHIDFDCLKVVTTVGNKKYVLRGCQLAEQSNFDICAKLQKENTKMLFLEHCSRCGVDYCNAATKNMKFSLFLLLPLMMPILYTCCL